MCDTAIDRVGRWANGLSRQPYMPDRKDVADLIDLAGGDVWIDDHPEIIFVVPDDVFHNVAGWAKSWAQGRLIFSYGQSDSPRQIGMLPEHIQQLLTCVLGAV
jgi:hypothetical protein